MHGNMWISKRLYLYLLLFVTSRPAQIYCFGDEPSAKVLTNISTLPKPFTNDDLPSSTSLAKTPADDGQHCYNFMGCYRNIPIPALHVDPARVKTLFKMSYKEQESVVDLGVRENCLESNPDLCDRYPFDLQQLVDSPFDPRRRTIIIIGGYHSKSNTNWEAELKKLWSDLDDVNIIVVGWESSNDGIYTNAAANTRPVARQLTVLLYYLAKLKGTQDLDLNDDAYMDKFYILGHSLGAHIAGFVGQDLAGRLGRITGLDPAGPSFDSLDRQFRIDRSDARFVDVIHSNAGAKLVTFKTQLGSALASGHIDLWANNGRHQPGCSNEFTGCSHKRSIKFFESFLNDLLSMRKYLGNNYRQLYRLRAYRSDSFEEFQQGSSLARLCPTASLDDNDLSYADLGKCSIPIDYLSWYNDYRQELVEKHDLNLNDTVTTSTPNNFYFFTNAQADDQLDHYLIKIRTTKSLTTDQNESYKESPAGGTRNMTDGCSVSVDFEMADELDNNYRIDNYHLMSFEDHYEILFPILAPNTFPKYEIAKMDSKDFYVERRDEDDKEELPAESMKLLRASIDMIFPKSVILRGFREDEDASGAAGKKKTGFLDSIKRFFKGNSHGQQQQDSDGDNQRADASSGVNCELTIKSFVIQPLRKFRRHLSALYMRPCSNHDHPEPEVNVVLLGNDEHLLRKHLTVNTEEPCDRETQNEQDNTVRLLLKTIFIGPSLGIESEEMNGQADEDFSSDANNSHKITSEEANDGASTDKRTSDAKLWLALTVILLVVLAALVGTSLPAMKRSKIDTMLNKQTMVMINANRATLSSR